MTAGIWFWILYAVCLIFSGGWYWRSPESKPFAPYGLVFFVLIGLLGWGVFGPPIR